MSEPPKTYSTYVAGYNDFDLHPCVVSVSPRKEDFNWQTPSITIKYVHGDWTKP